MLAIIDKRARAQLFRDRLRTAMAESGVTKAGLARATGINRSTVTQMLSDREDRMPGGQVVAGVAATLGVTTDWLLGLSDSSERVGALLDVTISDAHRGLGADDQLYAWHEEAAGYKIRHVPATLPDVLKTDAVMQWEYAGAKARTPGQAIEAAHARLDWMRGTSSDYEIAIPVHELENFANGSGYYAGLAPAARRGQLEWLIDVYDQLFPRLRLFLFDARTVFSAPLTVFGPGLAVLYVGRHFVGFRDRERVQAMTGHFDWLVREAAVSDRDVAQHIAALRELVEHQPGET